MTTIGCRATVIAAIALAVAVAGAEEQSASGDGGKSAQRRMRGTVKSVDRVTGEMSITVPGSDDEITVRLPPSKVSGFARGDEVDLSMDLGQSSGGDDRPAEKK